MTAADREFIERVKAAKSARRLSSLKYRDRSRLAFIVHSFNRISNIGQIVNGLRAVGNHELIVCEDGSLDGSHEKWMSYLNRPNDFLIHSNDLHEIRVLDRAIRFARADIVCLVQDDDLIPDNGWWLNSALAHFTAHPELAILGGFIGFYGFDPDPSKVVPLWGESCFRYVHHVNIGPYFIRTQAYETLGGWDHSFSRAGEPGICFDSELCLRAWMNGFRVAYSFVPFKGPPGYYALDGGTMAFAEDVRVRNQRRNSQRIWDMYGQHAQRIDALVREANAEVRTVNDEGQGGTQRK